MQDTLKQENPKEVLNFIDQVVHKDFDSNRRVLSFEEYLQVLAENPVRQTRSSAQSLVDMLDYFKKSEVESQNGYQTFRFHLFDRPVDGTSPKVVGQERVQTKLYRALKSFSRQKMNNKLLLLHGPNGSAKSTLVRSLMGGLEDYSKTDDGATYTFNWVFPVDRYAKQSIGMQRTNKPRNTESYARLADEDVAARFPCDLKDHPFLLIPIDQRESVLQRLLGEKRAAEIYPQLSNYHSKGDLCHRCRLIFDALLAANQGDYARVLQHVQIERYYYSRRYRRGLVTVEPQLHVDASYSQLTLNKSVAALPASLLNLNFFTLNGDIVDGNRGIIEYSDLLKRPVDSFKYLLGACETGSVNVGPSIVHLDSVMVGSSNELQLDAFKEFPDFGSFKARIELIRVPYLLSYKQEEEIYQLQLQNLSTEKPVAPHVASTLALWAVLTRLKKPNSINYPPNISAIISNLTPIQKARLYSTEEMPAGLSSEERQLLRSNITKLKEEYENIPFYEGRVGASAREIKNILYDAAQNPAFDCLSPLSVLREMEEFVKRVNEYDFLKQDVKEGYHDANDFVNIVREEFLNLIDREVRSSIGLYDATQWERFLKNYVLHLSHLLKKEKIQNPITGKQEAPDTSLIDEFETIVSCPKEKSEKQAFRAHVISQIGAWSLDHPGGDVVYAEIFPEYWSKLEKHYYETQKGELLKMRNALELRGTDEDKSDSEGSRLADQTIANMKKNLGYCDHCAKEVIIYLLKSRY